MGSYKKSLQLIIDSLRLLPGIGYKSAERIAYHLLSLEEGQVRTLANSLITARQMICVCSECGGLTASDPCSICSDEWRQRDAICVVESARDIDTIEKSGVFKGLYHSLNGLLNPLQGKGVEQIRINELMFRINNLKVAEVILALSSTVEGEATALYLAGLIAPLNVKVSRLAAGLPAGTSLEVVAPSTLAAALRHRTSFG
ncbi:MAG: recombination mediator RecR [Negativicutes bacterium]|nr:recombination mediator RecR [Negativicutes bacterium]